VVLAEQHLAFEAGELVANVIGHPQFLAQPQRHRHQVRAPAARRACRVGFQQALEFDQGLLVEAHEVNLRHADARFAQAIGNCIRRKCRIVLLPCEALLLGRGNNAAVNHQTGR
jgi:hypothetical protein